jgi:hypothetical protein
VSIPHRRASDHSCSHNIAHILMHGDLSLVGILLGFGMIMWSVVGLVIIPGDLYKFAEDFFFVAPLFWAFNGMAVGIANIALSCRGYPQGWTLALGIYGTVIYTWIAVARPVASVTSGVTLNVLVVIIHCLLIHRSGVPR